MKKLVQGKLHRIFARFYAKLFKNRFFFRWRDPQSERIDDFWHFASVAGCT